jgi:hypothetical protein
LRGTAAHAVVVWNRRRVGLVHGVAGCH